MEQPRACHVCFTIPEFHGNPDQPEQNFWFLGRFTFLCSGRDLNAIQITYLVRRPMQCKPKRRGALKFRGPYPDELVVGLGGSES